MKKFVSGVLALAIVFGASAAALPEDIFTSISASANDGMNNSGSYYGFTYYKYVNTGYIELTHYDEDADKIVTIPSVIDGCDTITLSAQLINYFNFKSPATAVKVGPNQEAFFSFNRHYFDQDCALYSYNTITDEIYPVIVPNGMTGWQVKNNIASLLDESGAGVAANHKNLIEICMPEKIGTLGNFSLFGLNNLVRVEFPKNCNITYDMLEESKLGFTLDTKNNGTKKITSFVISCYSGSGAEKYAKAHGFKCWLIDKAESSESTADDARIDIADMKISIPKNTYVCTGKQVKPAVTVKNGSEVLQEDVDYTIEYSPNLHIGLGVVTIKGMGDYSGSKSINFNIIPGNVTGFNAFAYSKSAVQLKWNTVKGAEGYIVYQYDDAAKTYKRIARISNPGTSEYFVWSLKSGTTYKYAIKAFGIAGSNKETLSAKFPVATVSTKLDTVNFTLTPSSKSVNINWKKVNGAKGYIVYYKTSKNGKWTKLTTTKGTSYTKTGLKSGKTYYFTVKAYRKVDGVQYNGGYTTKTAAAK